LWKKYYEFKIYINSEKKKKLADRLTKFSNRNKKNNSFENQVFFLIIKKLIWEERGVIIKDNKYNHELLYTKGWCLVIHLHTYTYGFQSIF